MKNAVCVLLVLLTASPAGAKVFYVHPPDPSAAGIIIDHNCVDLSAIPQIHIAPAASLRLLLRHASVGQGIGWGLDCFAGLHPTNSECSCYLPGQYPRDNWLLELRAGNWKDKVDDLVTQAETRTDQFDVFTMKFCYIDALGDSHPDWDYYRSKMEQLELDYPDKVFVWWTIPLTRDGMPGTDFFNALVRSYCRANGKILFDIADIECHDPNGLKQTNDQGCEVICQDYTKEIHAGHLNVPGRIRVASALWQLMASIAGWHKGSIQAAIDAASNGDTIVVEEGTYFENINFRGKNIVLTSTDPSNPDIVAATVIDGNQAGCVITFAGTEDETCVLAGFTICNGYDTWAGGICGGTWEVATHAIIRNNMITENTLWNGGAVVFCDGLIQNNTVCKTSILCTGAALCDCQGTIQGNAIIDNPCTGLVRCSGLVHNNYISGNSTALANCSGIIQNNTISDNLCEGLGLCNGIIQNNIISNNREGIYRGDEAIIRNNVITGNWAGGLIYCHGEIRNNLIAGNSSALGGGLDMCGGTIENNTIAHNSASNGGGFYCCGGTIRNCIIWGNTATEGAQLYGSSQPSYSCIQDWMEGGEGNIDADPCFVKLGYWDNNGTPDDSENDFWVEGDYHLKSQAGRWDANEGRWAMDEVTSPCIDAGDPMTAIGREPFPNGGRINMGAYGGTAEASKSYFDKPPCEIIVAGDINGDCAVNFLDFRLMALRWLTNGNF